MQQQTHALTMTAALGRSRRHVGMMVSCTALLMDAQMASERFVLCCLSCGPPHRERCCLRFKNQLNRFVVQLNAPPTLDTAAAAGGTATATAAAVGLNGRKAAGKGRGTPSSSGM